MRIFVILVVAVISLGRSFAQQDYYHDEYALSSMKGCIKQAKTDFYGPSASGRRIIDYSSPVYTSHSVHDRKGRAIRVEDTVRMAADKAGLHCTRHSQRIERDLRGRIVCVQKVSEYRIGQTSVNKDSVVWGVEPNGPSSEIQRKIFSSDGTADMELITYTEGSKIFSPGDPSSPREIIDFDAQGRIIGCSTYRAGSLYEHAAYEHDENGFITGLKVHTPGREPQYMDYKCHIDEFDSMGNWTRYTRYDEYGTPVAVMVRSLEYW